MSQNPDQQTNAEFAAKAVAMDALHNQIFPAIQNHAITRNDLKEALKKASPVVLEASVALDDHAHGGALSAATIGTIGRALKEAQSIIDDVILAFATVPF
jgi:hypothetical protein